MTIPRVFHSKTRTYDPWGVRYRSSETTDWFPNWEDAMRKALTWWRVSNRASIAAAEAEAAEAARRLTEAMDEATETTTYRGAS
jgi:hypothetical protein